MYTPYLDMMYKATNYASAADDIKCFIMWDMLRTLRCFLVWWNRLIGKMASCPAARFRFAQVAGVAVCRQYHVTCIECEESLLLC